MRKLVHRRSQKTGLPPGTLVHIGEKKSGQVKISRIHYNETRFEEKNLTTLEELSYSPDQNTVTWINVDGLHQIDVLEKLGTNFNIHPLALEDILNTEQRPKLEDYGQNLFIVLKMLYPGKDKDEVVTEQVSLIVGPHYLISLQEEPEHDVFDVIRQRLRDHKGRIRAMGADYLAYTFIDAIVDHYFIVLEKMGDDIESLEERLITSVAGTIPQKIHCLRREMIFLRKHVWPLREVINNLQKSESNLLQKTTMIYFRDVYDHTIQIIDAIDSFRDILAGLHDIYLSAISNRLNEIMKILTIFTAVFIPLTFIAGVYGMNFKYMPELEWRWGYFSLIGFMIFLGVGMLAYFKKKKWL